LILPCTHESSCWWSIGGVGQDDKWSCWYQALKWLVVLLKFTWITIIWCKTWE
jgi:hypothetical protein